MEKEVPRGAWTSKPALVKYALARARSLPEVGTATSAGELARDAGGSPVAAPSRMAAPSAPTPSGFSTVASPALAVVVARSLTSAER